MISSRATAAVQDPASVQAAIEGRFSCRAFLRNKAVDRKDIEEILRVASQAASGTNTQPSKVYVLQGERRDTLVNEVCAVDDAVYADAGLAEKYREEVDYYPAQWVSPYLERRRQNGWSLYGLLSIARGEKKKMHAQLQRNYHFFDAPVGLIFTVDRVLGRGSLIDYGMFLQNIMLMARTRGLHTCPQVAWNHYSKTIMPIIGAGATRRWSAACH
ncbi:nitroreductase family protein [Arthrobacter sp. ISL-85]|uniref:nitroreductase family protein n=1 Tax=Arthrobacter sp. ISL-85 TaxID=2819115 RepID=UPI001BEB2169|nr:nitroreductase family protein [Arthrobacter sp. ISL-85]MBT2565217.1 nitroreductase family protein [Arthrobacter sp. ISL-85]